MFLENGSEYKKSVVISVWLAPKVHDFEQTKFRYRGVAKETVLHTAKF